eukprot:TRINITY_DN91_c1_g1_i1.p1 TRINITY_DN91_c1_g1~~TRINITY_DN91_c1_g1_i1.p1  ORF type:complete len:401 (-),score=101.55 TRINITY_DN91_c1_g1_i1:56-1210(-)
MRILLFSFILIGVILMVKVSNPRPKVNLIDMINICPNLMISEKIEMQEIEGMGNCLVAVEDIDENEEVLIVPVENGTLTAVSMMKHYPIFENITDFTVPWVDIFGYYTALLYLSEHEHVGLELLSEECTNMVDYKEEIKKYFPKGSYEYFTLMDDVDKEKYNSIVEKLPAEMKISYSDYLWGICCIYSRSFMPIDENFGMKYGSLHTIGVGDLVNHDQYKENVLYRSVLFKGDYYWQYFSKNKITKGSQIYNSYYGFMECSPKLDMLMRYGFLPLNEEDDLCNSIYINEKPLNIQDSLVFYDDDDKSTQLDKLIKDEIAKYEAIPSAKISDNLQKLVQSHLKFLNKALGLLVENNENHQKGKQPEKKKQKIPHKPNKKKFNHQN